MSIEFRAQRILENLKKFPSLKIGLSEEQIFNAQYMSVFRDHTEHQKQACRIAGKILGWHPAYVYENIMSRPSLMDEIEDIHWAEKAAQWQHEHNLTVVRLASKYATDFDRFAYYRLYEPLDFVEGVIISAYDTGDPYFSSVADW